MKRTTLVALVSCLLLLGCAVCPPRIPGSFQERSNPKVTIENGLLTVRPDPLYFGPGEKGTITWHLETPGFRFASKGIEIGQPLVGPPQKTVTGNTTREVKRPEAQTRDVQDIRCASEPTGSGVTFTCENAHTRPGVYKYTIRVTNGSTEIELDPFIMNM